VLTLYVGRTKLADQVVAEIRAYFGSQVYQTVVPRSVRLSEAPGFGLPIIRYDPSSRAAATYRSLAAEFRTRAVDHTVFDLQVATAVATTDEPDPIPAITLEPGGTRALVGTSSEGDEALRPGVLPTSAVARGPGSEAAPPDTGVEADDVLPPDTAVEPGPDAVAGPPDGQDDAAVPGIPGDDGAGSDPTADDGSERRSRWPFRRAKGGTA
jgi:hypothetical protein